MIKGSIESALTIGSIEFFLKFSIYYYEPLRTKVNFEYINLATLHCYELGLKFVERRHLRLTLFILQGTTRLLHHNITQLLTMSKNGHIYDRVGAKGTAHFTEIRNSMVDAVNAYYTAAQYLLWAYLKPPK